MSLFFDYAPGPDLIYRARVQRAAVLMLVQQQQLIPCKSRQGGPNIAQSGGRFKMVYINGAYDSKVWEEINHFETAQYGAML